MSRKDIVIDNNIYWTNKQGEKILIENITDVKYLQNIIKFLIRQKEKEEEFEGIMFEDVFGYYKQD